MEKSVIRFLYESAPQTTVHVVRLWYFSKPEIIRDASKYKANKFGFYALNGNSVVDFDMDLYRSFIFRNRGINAGMGDNGDKTLYIYKDASLRAEEETNLIRKIEFGDISEKDFLERKKRSGKFAILSNMQSDPRDIYEM